MGGSSLSLLALVAVRPPCLTPLVQAEAANPKFKAFRDKLQVRRLGAHLGPAWGPASHLLLPGASSTWLWPTGAAPCPERRPTNTP
jgi:hypothetical protein